MKKKIGLVTLFGNYNYGNKYQNYAVQAIASKYGYQADTIVFYSSLLREVYRSLKRQIQRIKGTQDIKRYDTFEAFNKGVLSVKKIYAPGYKVSQKLKNKYKWFFVGSDQVWNPEIRKDQRDIFFLSFADKNQRVSISPSIGVSHIDSELYDVYKSGLDGFNNLSCREDEGKVEIERISGKKCHRLIDPTMALKAEEWINFSRDRQDVLKKNYIVCFFLGEISKELNSIIQMYSKDYNLEVICPSSINSEYYNIDPRELIDILHKSTMIFTDSFHISAFSINLNKNFWVFNRYDSSSAATHISSRIQTLTDLFSLEERYITDLNRFTNPEKPCDFKISNDILEKERKRFYTYLELCFEQGEL